MFYYFSITFISVSVNVVCGAATAPLQCPPYVRFRMHLADQFPSDARKRLPIDLIAQIPRERVVAFDADLDMKLPGEVFLMMPNIRILSIACAELSKGLLLPIPNGPYANTKLLPVLEVLRLDDIILDGIGWSHLATYLAHQTSDGQPISLEIAGNFPYMGPEVVDKIKGLVREFVYQEGAMDDEQR